MDDANRGTAGIVTAREIGGFDWQAGYAHPFYWLLLS